MLNIIMIIEEASKTGELYAHDVTGMYCERYLFTASGLGLGSVLSEKWIRRMESYQQLETETQQVVTTWTEGNYGRAWRTLNSGKAESQCRI